MGPPLQSLFCIRLWIPVSLNTLLFLTISTLPTASISQLETRYIDDEYGDLVTGIQPVYTGLKWSEGATCSSCKFKPDPSKTFNGTWHDNTHGPTNPPSTVELTFTGITLDVYCLIPSTVDLLVTSEYSLTFVLDGLPLNEPFTYDGFSIDIQYNVSVLSLTNLNQVSHTLTMIAAAPVITTAFQFDYAKYTVDTDLLPLVSNSSGASSSSIISPTPTTPPLSSTSPSNTTATTPFHHHTATSSSSDLPTTKKHSNLAALIGSTIGGILFLVLSLALIFYYRRYKHRIRQRFFTHNKMRVDPFYSLGADQQGPLVPYNRPFIDPPAKNALWNPSNVMQEVEDPRAVKRAADSRDVEAGRVRSSQQ